MQSDQVGGGLAAHAGEGDDEGLADLPAHQARHLDRGPEGQGVLRAKMQHGEEDDARQGEALADRLQQLGGQELVRSPQGRQAVGHHQAGDGDTDEADRGHQARVDAAEQEGGQGTEYELGRGDPDQGLAHLQRAEAAHHLQVLGDQVGRRQDGQAQEGDQHQEPGQWIGEGDLQVDQGVAGDRLVDEEAGHDHGAGEQQAGDLAGIEPIQAVALVEPGIDQGEAHA